MKVSELSIGDWVLDTEFERNEPDRVCIVEDDGRVWLKNRNCYQSVTYCEPIPITPEILEKNGFVANNHVFPYPYYEYIKLKIGFAFPQGNRTSSKDPWVCIDSEYVFVKHLPCIYVHQLQHAFCLCGIKKEIEL